MSEDSNRFRIRARECRELVPRAQDPVIREMLKTVAIELEEAADEMDAEEAENNIKQ